MTIKWLGHSCFLLSSDSGTRIMTDPPDLETGYNIDPIAVDAVTSSHNHHDHAYFELALGDPVRITQPGSYTVKDVAISGFHTWHDSQQGAVRGDNIVFKFEIDDLCILHAGDLGHIPDEATISAIGHVDVLLVPIGGVYTIDYAAALELCNYIKPKVVIPMHYRTSALAFKLGELMPFLSAARDCTVHRMRQDELTLTHESLGNDRIIALEYGKAAWVREG